MVRRWRRRARRPVACLLAVAHPIPLALLLVAGHPVLALLVPWGAAAGVTLQVRAHRRERRALEGLERGVRLVYEDWVRAETQRGHAEVERWLRAHRP